MLRSELTLIISQTNAILFYKLFFFIYYSLDISVGEALTTVSIHMICCSTCHEWYHGEVCVAAIPKNAWNQKKEKWFCPVRCIYILNR